MQRSRCRLDKKWHVNANNRLVTPLPSAILYPMMKIVNNFARPLAAILLLAAAFTATWGATTRILAIDPVDAIRAE